MKSFLECISDTSLAWTTDDDDDDISYSSSGSSSYSSGDALSDEEDQDVRMREAVPLAPVPVPLQPAQQQQHQHQHQHHGGEGNEGAANRVHAHAHVHINAHAHAHVHARQEEQLELQNQHPAPLAAAVPARNPHVGILQGEPNGPRTQNNILEILRTHHRSNTMLFRVARCEELPLIRAEIDWRRLQHEVPTYPGVELGDESGAHLLQSVLRTDPPCEVLREILKRYPKSCVNMDSFYAACQHASDDVVQLIMRQTMKARKTEGISWGMLAFLGDARIRINHAQFLLQCAPEAVIDPMHGMFGISPLDRMMSGAFIHGEYGEWVGKLKLAIFTAERGRLMTSSTGIGTDAGTGTGTDTDTTTPTEEQEFRPFHSIVKRLVSPDFMGIQFGASSFVHSLTACVESETDNPPFHQMDERGNLPLHVVLQKHCHTNLGTKGERKLIKFLLHAHSESAMIPDASGRLPIHLAVENGWPVYDIIANACPQEYSMGRTEDGSPSTRNTLLHDVLTTKFNDRFGVSGARTLVKFLLKRYPLSAAVQNQDGRLPLHIATENGWPCHDLLVAAAPSALEMRDPKTGFLPFMIATRAQMQGQENQKANELSTLYELIRWGPLLLKGLGNYTPVVEKGVKPVEEEGKGVKRMHDEIAAIHSSISDDEPMTKR